MKFLHHYRPSILGVFQHKLARSAFPCFDDLKYPATFELILQHDEQFTCVSNMPVKNMVRDLFWIWAYCQKKLLKDFLENSTLTKIFWKVLIFLGKVTRLSLHRQCVKSVQIRSFSGPHFPVFSPNTGKYGPEKNLYLDTFQAVRCIFRTHSNICDDAEIVKVDSCKFL